jgi:Icc-related predicted phosphoesterase
MTDGKLTIAAIGDLHVSESVAHPYRDLFVEMSQRADVIALCGDLTNHGKLREAEVLAEDMRSARVPVVGVLGNHDLDCGLRAEVERILGEGGLTLLEDETAVIEGVGFAGVKGFAGGFDDRMLSPFGEEAIKLFVQEVVNEAMRLENALRAVEGERVVVLLHYSPIAATVEGEPREIFPFMGSSRLAETIDRFERVRAVLHGHAHHGSYAGHTAKGIPVYNVAQTIEKEGGRPYALITV